MFGPDVLVAPIMYEKTDKRSVYLPKGHKWTLAWTNVKYDGGQTIEVDAPIDQIPVFTRDDVVLPITK